MPLNDVLHNGEAHPGALDGGLRGRSAAEELLVDVRLLGRWNPCAAIGYAHCDASIDAFNANCDWLVIRRIFRSVLEQIPQGPRTLRNIRRITSQSQFAL